MGLSTPPVFPWGAAPTLQVSASTLAPPTWCAPEHYCAVLQGTAYVHLWANGSVVTTLTSEAPGLETAVADPTGRTEAVTYAAAGGVVWELCGPACYFWYVQYGYLAETEQYWEDLGGTSVSTRPAADPVTLSVSPASGTGATMTFAAQYAAATGYADVEEAWMVINDQLSGTQACLLPIARGGRTSSWPTTTSRAGSRARRAVRRCSRTVSAGSSWRGCRSRGPAPR